MALRRDDRDRGEGRSPLAGLLKSAVGIVLAVVILVVIVIAALVQWVF